MAGSSTTTKPHVALQHGLPPLENGDRLTRDEFERRYEAMPHLKKAELIEGVVYVPSPVRYHRHTVAHGCERTIAERGFPRSMARSGGAGAG